MNILKQSNARLKLIYNPGYKSAGILMVWGGLLALAFLESTTFTSAHLTCRRNILSQIECELTRFNAFGYATSINIINPIKADIVELQPKGRAVQEVIIITAQREYSLLTHDSINYQNNQQSISEINDFIQNYNKKFLSIKYNGQSFASLPQRILLITFIITGVFISTAAVVTWTFDKNCNKLIQEQKSIRINKIFEYSINEISDIQIEQNSSFYIRNNTRHKTYRVVLVMANSDFIPLTPDYCFPRKSDAEHIVQSLQQFLDNSSVRESDEADL